MKVGEIFEAIVTDLTSGGQGVVRHPSGQTVFASGVWLDEKASFRLLSKRGRVGFAEVHDLIETHPMRRQPPCVHQGFTQHSCGACPWMFVSYQAQLEAKQKRVKSAVRRFSLDDVVGTIWASDTEFAYRNRAQFKTDGNNIGFVAPQSNKLAPIQDCLVIDEHNRAVLRQLVDTLPNAAWRPQKKNTWLTLDVDESVDIETVSVNQRLPFQQANHAQNQRMKQWLNNKLESLSEGRSVLELFCGSGNFTSEISSSGFAHITAVEGDHAALTRLQEKHLKNVEAIRADLFNEAEINKLARTEKECSILVLDPPRSGFKLIDLLLSKKHKFKDIFYISCDLATFARDMAMLIEKGFKVQELQPLDQFPQTPHVELLCHLKK